MICANLLSIFAKTPDAEMRSVRISLLLTGSVLFCALLGSLWTTRQALPSSGGEDTAALTALSVALGGTRGILSEILWWRIGDLQKQARYAELLPLTDFLVTLDPDSPDTWVYNAWNLAYNLSAIHQDPDEKWRWVRRGIELIARGLRRLPDSPVLLRQMGWFWEDKICGSADGASAYYRTQAHVLPHPENFGDLQEGIGGGSAAQHPMAVALAWYLRADHARDSLRAASALWHQTHDVAMLPLLIRLAARAWEELAPQQQASFLEFAADIQGLPPQTDALLKTLHVVR